MKNVCKILIVLILASCSNKNSRLEQALLLAGDNRSELEKVLLHYTIHEKDSLKYKAAIFLIENMPGHYSYEREKINEFYQSASQILKEKRGVQEIKNALIQLSDQYLPVDSIEDVQLLTADFLIANIEDAFKAWEKPWAYHLDFEQFREYILPYKCVELQEPDNWRQFFRGKHLGGLNFMPANDEYSHSTPQAASEINKDLGRMVKQIQNLTKDYAGIRLRNTQTMKSLPFGNCMDYSILAATVMRSNGVPVVLEYVPQWGRSGNGHEWHTILSNNGKHQAFIWNLESNPGDPLLKSRQIPKVMRYTYKANPVMEDYLQNSRYQMSHITKFQKDVTDNYTATEDLAIPVRNKVKLADSEFVHLGIFDNKEWRPIDFGVLKKGKAHFHTIGRDAVYIVLGYDAEKLIPISDPFILHAKGNIEYCIPDTSHLKQVSLTRKYPKDMQTALMEQLMKGGEIQASNDKDFKEFKTIYAIQSNPYPIPIETQEETPYRYWRYKAVGRLTKCNFAELQFLEADNDFPLEGTFICSEDVNNPAILDNIKKGFDGDWLTNLSLPIEGWVGIDFGNPIVVEKVVCVPRSDDNSIHLKDLYELKYWADNNWVSLGIQEAESETLHFENVSDKAILLLSNIDRVKQAVIFTYENGKHIWW